MCLLKYTCAWLPIVLLLAGEAKVHVYVSLVHSSCRLFLLDFFNHKLLHCVGFSAGSGFSKKHRQNSRLLAEHDSISNPWKAASPMKTSMNISHHGSWFGVRAGQLVNLMFFVDNTMMLIIV